MTSKELEGIRSAVIELAESNRGWRTANLLLAEVDRLRGLLKVANDPGGRCTKCERWVPITGTICRECLDKEFEE